MKESSVLMAVVGAGPRGLSVLERLTAYADEAKNTLFEVILIDPYAPGAGKIWRADQSRLYVMNTPGLFPTVVPTNETNLKKTLNSGLSFDAWRKKLADPRAERYGVLTAEDEEELHGISASEFPAQQYPSRVLYGSYLRWIYQRLLLHLPGNVRVEHRAQQAVRIIPEELGARSKFRIRLADGDHFLADDVVLAMGHVPARYAEQQLKFLGIAGSSSYADSKGRDTSSLLYFPAVVPSCAAWDDIPGGREVLVRGLGLNFFDLMIQVTQGRGGKFVPSGEGELLYQASGREPYLVAGSRRGVPYHARPVVSGYYSKGVRLHCFDDVVLRRLLRENSGNYPEGLSFERDLWPRLHQDLQRNYYRILSHTQREAFRGNPGEFLTFYEAAAEECNRSRPEEIGSIAENTGSLASRYVQEPWHFDFNTLSNPLGEKYFSNAEEHHREVLNFIKADVKRAFAGANHPLGVVIETLRRARAVFKALVDEKAINTDFQGNALFLWFDSSAAFLSSGPPVIRMQQLLALANAGFVSFVGPAAEYDVNENEFLAVSRQVAGGRRSAQVLVDAFTPPNQVAETADELLQHLIADGVATLKMANGEEMSVPSGLDVSQCPYQVLDRRGKVVNGLYVIGLQLSAVQLGTTTAAEANPRTPRNNPSGSCTLYDADAIAQSVVRSGKPET